MGFPQGFEWIIVLIVALIVFGPKNLPKIGRAIGQSLRGFKEEMKGINETSEEESEKEKKEKEQESTTKPSDESK
jgi:sec-independent protein translocase protein TatA